MAAPREKLIHVSSREKRVYDLNQPPPSRAVSLLFIAVIGGVACLPPVSVDGIVPAIPAIARGLSVPVNYAQLVVTSYMIGFAMGQLGWGFGSERYGRRPILLAGLGLFTAASILAALSPTADVLLFARALQGMGAAVAPSVGRAAIRDVADGTEGARLMSINTTIVGFAPLIAPIIGGFLVSGIGWRSVFVFNLLVGMGLIAAVSAHLPETLKVLRPEAIYPRQVLKALREFLRSRDSVYGFSLTAFGFAGMFAFISGGTTVLIEVYRIPTAYAGLLFALPISGMMIGAFVNSRLVTWVPVERLIVYAVASIAIGGCLHAIIALGWSDSLILLLTAAALSIFSIGIILPNATMVTLQPLGHMAGAALALMGTMQALIGAGTSYVVAAFYDSTATALTGTAAIAAAITLVILILWRRQPTAEG